MHIGDLVRWGESMIIWAPSCHFRLHKRPFLEGTLHRILNCRTEAHSRRSELNTPMVSANDPNDHCFQRDHATVNERALTQISQRCELKLTVPPTKGVNNWTVWAAGTAPETSIIPNALDVAGFPQNIYVCVCVNIFFLFPTDRQIKKCFGLQILTTTVDICQNGSTGV